MIFPNTSILDPDNGPTGFATPDFTMAAVPIIGSREYILIVDGKQHEHCKDRKTAEIKLEQLWNANRKGRKGTKTPAKRKSRKKRNSLILNPCGGKESQNGKPSKSTGSTPKPKSKPKSKSVPVDKPSTEQSNPLLDALK